MSCLLTSHVPSQPHEAIPLESFLALWADALPDAFARHISLPSLLPDYLLDATPSTSSSIKAPTLLTPFPLSRLPPDAPARFASLFATRARWRLADLRPLVADLCTDDKARDKLISKFARVVKERVAVEPQAGAAAGPAVKREKGGGGKKAGQQVEFAMVDFVYSRSR